MWSWSNMSKDTLSYAFRKVGKHGPSQDPRVGMSLANLGLRIKWNTTWLRLMINATTWGRGVGGLGRVGSSYMWLLRP